MSPQPSLALEFDQLPVAGAGFVEVFRAVDGSLLAGLAAVGSVIEGNTATLDPDLTLEFQTGYYVLVGPDAFHDGGDGYFPGIAGQV